MIYPNPSPNSTERPREVSWLIQGHTASRHSKFYGLYLTSPSLSSNILFLAPPLMSALPSVSPTSSLLSPVAHSVCPSRLWPLGRFRFPERPCPPRVFSDPGCRLPAASWPFHQGLPSGSKRKVGSQNPCAFPMCLAWCVQAGVWLVGKGALGARDRLAHVCVLGGWGE